MGGSRPLALLCALSNQKKCSRPSSAVSSRPACPPPRPDGKRAASSRASPGRACSLRRVAAQPRGAPRRWPPRSWAQSREKRSSEVEDEAQVRGLRGALGGQLRRTADPVGSTGPRLRGRMGPQSAPSSAFHREKAFAPKSRPARRVQLRGQLRGGCKQRRRFCVRGGCNRREKFATLSRRICVVSIFPSFPHRRAVPPELLEPVPERHALCSLQALPVASALATPCRGSQSFSLQTQRCRHLPHSAALPATPLIGGHPKRLGSESL